VVIIRFCILGFQVSPEEGTVGFGSGLQGWAFILGDFANMYATKLGVSADKLRKRLWSDNYYHSPPKDKKQQVAKGEKAPRKWVTVPKEDYTRGFNLFVLKPIYDVSFCD
jgi:elongation factor 2